MKSPGRGLAAGALAAVAAMGACARQHIVTSDGAVEEPARRAGAGGAMVSASDRLVRVGLRSAGAGTRVSAAGGWQLFPIDGESAFAVATAGAEWRLERQGSRLRAVRGDGSPTAWHAGGLVARAVGEELLRYNGKRYRGELLFLPVDTGITVVNRVRMDDYLRGVVPLEIGTRAAGDSAAVQAQAVTARSYAYVHLGAASASRPFDLSSGVGDQVYGGADAETAVANAAVSATRGLVLRYAGRVVNAPYHSTCGGSTAEAGEIWRSGEEPYLQRVSDRIPGSDRFYCDIAPRFRWTRRLDGVTLRAALVRYLATYAAVAGANPGSPRDIQIDSRTASGRVGTLRIATDRGNYILRGNDTRYVLRAPGGEILNSTYFSVETAVGRDGAISEVTLRGMGYGHGVGMCQWGAIGRARAGQDFRTILATYYRGTTVGLVE